MEQRAYPRRPIVTLCRISRAGSQACEGSTENISRNGIMLQLPSRDSHQEPLRSGDCVTLEIALPKSRLFGPRYLCCQGTVVRVLPGPDGMQNIAVYAPLMKFRDRADKVMVITSLKSITRLFKKGGPVRGGLRSSVPEEKGHAVVELALLSPWILLLFAAVFDFGFYAYAAISTANAARVGAHVAASSSVAAADSSGACLLVVEELRRLPGVGTSACSCGVSNCTAGPITVTATAVPAASSADGSPAAQVAVAYQTVNLFPLPWFPGKMTITRTVQERLKE